MTQMAQNRRRFLATLSAAGATQLIGPSNSFAQEAPPETTIIRLAKNRTICIAPQYVVADLLRLEGFTEVRYVATDAGAGQSKALARGDIDLTLQFSALTLIPIDAGERITIIAGVHVGCFELFASEGIRSIATSRARRWRYRSWAHPRTCSCRPWPLTSGSTPPRTSTGSRVQQIPPMELFADGKIDAFLGFPPEPQELRARKIGHVVVNSSVDRPWSQYFCCMLAGNRDFIRKNPVATKRAMRAILKATDFCVSNPAGAARRMVDGGFTARYDYALQTLKDVPYNKWREYDPEDTIRFYALRLREVGHDQVNPQQDHRRRHGLAFPQRA